MKHPPVVNTHCHIFNFEFIPNEMVKLLAVLPEEVFVKTDGFLPKMIETVSKLFPGPTFDRILNPGSRIHPDPLNEANANNG